MRPIYKKVKQWVEHCPNCQQELSGNNSLAFPWQCDCGIWKAIVYPFKGEYEIKGK